MDSFDEKLNNILSSPEAMNRIMSMAQSLGGGGAGGQNERPSLPASQEETPASGGGDNPLGALDLLQNLDPNMVSKAMKLMTVYNTPDDERANLLKAIKPYLRRERWGKVEKASQYMKLARVARVAMQDLFKGG